MAEFVVGVVEDLPPGSKRVVTVKGIEIGVFNVNGSYYALPNRCTHQWGPLCEGAVAATVTASAATDWRPEWTREGQVIVCPWHALEFDVTTGQCLAHPKVKLRQYSVRVDNGQITLIL